MIVENGLGAKDELIKDENGNYTVKDDYRISYLKEHLKQKSSGESCIISHCFFDIAAKLMVLNLSL